MTGDELAERMSVEEFWQWSAIFQKRAEEAERREREAKVKGGRGGGKVGAYFSKRAKA